MNAGDWDLTPGKVHRQLEGPDMQDYAYSTTIDGRTLRIDILLPAGMDGAAVADELRRRALTLAEMFEGTPVRLAYDTMSNASPRGGLADAHTAAQLAGG